MLSSQKMSSKMQQTMWIQNPAMGHVFSHSRSCWLGTSPTCRILPQTSAWQSEQALGAGPGSPRSSAQGRSLPKPEPLSRSDLPRHPVLRQCLSPLPHTASGSCRVAAVPLRPRSPCGKRCSAPAQRAAQASSLRPPPRAEATDTACLKNECSPREAPG